jgi:hypothetical protein
MGIGGGNLLLSFYRGIGAYSFLRWFNTMERNHLKNQKGVSLVIALMILLVLTLIGISAISTTTFETNIAGNERLYNKAFYTSDAGVDYFVGWGASYISIPTSIGVVDSRTEGLPLGGDYFLVNWERRVSDLGPPKVYEFKITSQGISPNFPAAGRINIEAIIGVVDTMPPPEYPGGST